MLQLNYTTTVKSTLSKAEFEKALVKMANNKKMFLDRKGAQEPIFCLEEKDEIISFLICNNLDFNIDDIDFENIYRDIPDVRFRHNMILSLQEGLLLYEFDAQETPEVMKVPFGDAFEEGDQVMWYFPHSTVMGQKYKCKPEIIKVDIEDIYEHVIHFLNGLNNAMYGQREYKLDIGRYLTNDLLRQRNE